MDFDEIGVGESALKVAGNIYIWSIWAEYNDTFSSFLTVQKLCTWQKNISHYEQYVLFEVWASILLFNRKQELLSVPVCGEYLNCWLTWEILDLCVK
jgi:hypothetical protein